MGLFGATKHRIIRRASDGARHCRSRYGNCVPELNPSTLVQLQLQQTRVITVKQVRFDCFDVHGSRSTSIHRAFLVYFIPLLHYLQVENNCPGAAVLAILGRCAIIAFTARSPSVLCSPTNSPWKNGPNLPVSQPPAPTPRLYRDKRWNLETLYS